jgi:hypothetical protein
MTFNSKKVLGLVAVVATLGLAEARAQAVKPGTNTLPQQAFTALLLAPPFTPPGPPFTPPGPPPTRPPVSPTRPR